MTSQPIHRRALIATVVGAAALLCVQALPAEAHSRPIDLQILSFNDYHGHLEPPTGTDATVLGSAGAITAGGSEYLTTHLRELREGHESTLTVAAGDLIGGSPFLSGLFKDEPAIETLNNMDVDVSSVGNHEFDEGVPELLRMQYGGCNPIELLRRRRLRRCELRLPGRQRHVQGRRQGREARGPAQVRQVVQGADRPDRAAADLDPADQGDQRRVHRDDPGGHSGTRRPGRDQGRQLLRRGRDGQPRRQVPAVEGHRAIVVLLHEGGLPVSGATYDYDCNAGSAAAISGPIVDIAKNLSPSIDMLVTGHTHQPYTCNIPDPAGQTRWVTSAASYGRVITETELKLDPRTEDVIRDSVATVNHAVTRDVTPAADQTAAIAKWKGLSAPIANRQIGTITGAINRSVTRDASRAWVT